jgi:hypothetical protein
MFREHRAKDVSAKAAGRERRDEDVGVETDPHAG